ncbi:MAG: hypothetical protein WBD26_05775, partial [Candidatus Acidiferrales bacterium]
DLAVDFALIGNSHPHRVPLPKVRKNHLCPTLFKVTIIFACTPNVRYWLLDFCCCQPLCLTPPTAYNGPSSPFAKFLES